MTTMEITTTTKIRPSPKSRRRKRESLIVALMGLSLYLLWTNIKYTLGHLSIVKRYMMEQAKKTNVLTLSSSSSSISPPPPPILFKQLDNDLVVDSTTDQTIKSQMEVALSSLLSTIAVLENTTTLIRNMWPDILHVDEGQVVQKNTSIMDAASSSSSSLQSSAPTIDNKNYLPWPKLVFQCGWHADLLSNLVFPNVTRQEYQGFVSLQQLQQQQQRANNQTKSNITNTMQNEQEGIPLVVGMHGPCKLNEPKNATTPRNQMWVYVQQYYTPGKAIFFNGESFGDARGHNTYQVGTIAKSTTKRNNMMHINDKAYIAPSTQNRSLTDFYYMSLAFLELASTPLQRDAFFDHAKKPKNTGKYGVIYVASNCVTYRQVAADRISDVDPKNLKVYYGGKCHGLRGEQAKRPKVIVKPNKQKTASTRSKLLPVPKKLTGRQQYKKNSHAFQQYRYCLVMENVAKSGYITEKIVFAFLGGCVPIYYGTTEVFDIFNKNAFIFYDIKNPKAALQQIRYMEKENRTAYDEMLAQPILANGTATIEHYFSLQDDIGGGQLIRRIRALIGYNPNNPFQTPPPV